MIALDGQSRLTLAEHDDLMDRAMEVFGEPRPGSVWDRFAELLAIVGNAKRPQSDLAPPPPDAALATAKPLGVAGHPPSALTRITGFSKPSSAPLPVRMLFAATLQPDTVPADVAGHMGVFKKLTLIPRLLALAKLSGAYASRLLGRNVQVGEVLGHSVDVALPTESTRLLLRYFRSRFWARTLVGTRLSMVGSIHQHIHDFNAILFLARAQAHFEGAARLTDEMIRRALTLVEMHLANQPRLYDQVLKGWLRAQLDDIGLAWHSLRLMAPRSVVNCPVDSRAAACHRLR
jgi:hypothetical protein